MLERLSVQESCLALRRHIRTVLHPREQAVIRMRYGLDGLPPRTQREVASICGISRSYVSRLEKKALEKLRDAFAAEEQG